MRCLCYKPYQNRFLGLPGYPRLISADRRSLCGRLVNSPDDNRVFSTHRARDWRFPAGCDAGCKVDHLERFSGGVGALEGPLGGRHLNPPVPAGGTEIDPAFLSLRAEGVIIWPRGNRHLVVFGHFWTCLIICFNTVPGMPAQYCPPFADRCRGSLPASGSEAAGADHRSPNSCPSRRTVSDEQPYAFCAS
jgi:hypothetical protein